MPASYQPAQDAKPVPPWSIATLSERDLSLRVPINFVTVPGISLRQACFGHNVFDTDAAITCFSNLLAAGYRRYEWDLFWDFRRRVWSFCPVQIPQSELDGSTSTTRMLFNSSTVTLSDAVITARAVKPSPCDLIDVDTTDPRFSKRQDPGTVLTSSDSDLESATQLEPTLGGSATASTTLPPQSTSTTVPSDLISLGQYACSPSIDLPILAAVLDSYFENTSNTLEAFLVYLRLNLHAAALSGSSNSTGPLNSSSLPGSQEFISSLLAANLTSFLYTPSLLARERADVNATWFRANGDAQPLPGYYDLTHLGDHSSSEDGWPNEIYLEFEEQRRLLVEFGTIDSSMANYDASQDNNTVFPQYTLHNDRTNVEFTSSGDVEAGCLYDPNSSTLADNNNSWATYDFTEFPVAQDYDFATEPIMQVANLTSCGISAYLNTSVFNTTADANIGNYDDFLRSASWAWQYGEPRIVPKDEDNSDRVRCAAMDSSLNGRWRVVDCTDRHYAACRNNDEPFTWHISFSKSLYTASNEICDEGQSFGVPFTPIENRHLFQAMQRELPNDDLIWVNFNSLDVGDCWVVGVNNTCPYQNRTQDNDGRKIIVPLVAAIIVFIVTALTLFVKCAANRQTSKKRRRRKGEMDFPYEGIPQ